MIWTRGEVVPEEALRISVLDRTFEHGLGLFETLRTWRGHATLLLRHLDRMRRSAAALGLRLSAGDEPDAAAVRRLCAADGFGPDSDARLRITMTGGSGADGNSTLWMTAGTLPPEFPDKRGIRIDRTMVVDPADPLVRHKTLNYWRRRIEQERVAMEQADEVLCVTPDGLVCEGTRANIFLVERRRLLTPGTEGPLLAGILRGVAIERARRAGIEVVEGPVPLAAIAGADEAFLTNSLRGIVPIGRMLGTDWPAPGPITLALREDIRSWLENGGIAP
ncbi:MAG: aminotransferase class IV [Isosphaeraceae bacterium]